MNGVTQSARLLCIGRGQINEVSTDPAGAIDSLAQDKAAVGGDSVRRFSSRVPSRLLLGVARLAIGRIKTVRG